MKHANGFDYRRMVQAMNPDLLHRLPPRAGEETLFDALADGEGCACSTRSIAPEPRIDTENAGSAEAGKAPGVSKMSESAPL